MITITRWLPEHRDHPSRTTAGAGFETLGWSVRVDWANGTHCLARFAPSPTQAAASLSAVRRFWRGSPARPIRYSVVRVSRHDWHLHARRHDCAFPDCPQPPGSPEPPQRPRPPVSPKRSGSSRPGSPLSRGGAR